MTTETQNVPETPVPSTNPRRWLAQAAIAAATLMVVLDASTVNIVLPP